MAALAASQSLAWMRSGARQGHRIKVQTQRYFSLARLLTKSSWRMPLLISKSLTSPRVANGKSRALSTAAKVPLRNLISSKACSNICRKVILVQGKVRSKDQKSRLLDWPLGMSQVCSLRQKLITSTKSSAASSIGNYHRQTKNGQPKLQRKARGKVNQRDPELPEVQSLAGV